MAERKRAQIALEEELLDRPELAKLLDDREGAKEEMYPYRQNYLGLDKQVKAKVSELDLAEGMYRCGFFVIKVSDTEEKTVEFERHAGRRITIKPAKV